MQGSNESGHTFLIVVRCGIEDFLAIDIACNLVAEKTQLEVMPLQCSDVGHCYCGQRVLSSDFYILTCQDEGLLLSIADEFFWVGFPSGKDEGTGALIVYFQVVSLGPDAVAGAHIT